ncbi:cysteine hydrolase [archaeon]|nr:cysteine hydrolase [archaeon]
MKTIFWNVDTQYDFMNPDGKLSISNAMSITKNLEKLTNFARENKYQIVNTADWHNKYSKELSKKPDYRMTFPEHCMAETSGAEFIDETKPINPYVVDWQNQNWQYSDCKIRTSQEIVIYKDFFNIFEGNRFTKQVLDALNPNRIIIYGVASDVCVDQAIKGLRAMNKEVYVPVDAIKELDPNGLEELLNKWLFHGVKLTKTEDIMKYLSW